MKRRLQSTSLLILLAVSIAPAAAASSERLPGASWDRYARVEDAGFDAKLLEAAHQQWTTLPSSAFMVIADGAVVASWGDVERRYMCHSVRKSFLSALYGIYWDRGEIELNKTLANMGMDDEPSPLLESEKQARILDLLKARSGVFHPAAYAGRTDSRPRGSEGPGRFFAYNNWDFNTLATILEQETGASVFTAFDEHFAGPLGMQDWRVSDGYFHYERDKSKYPAYPFRMSARDAARFGLLFAREGRWGDQRILSEHWVRRSTALYSIDDDQFGYGFMWWVLREPQLEAHGMVGAFGVGNQMIAALPKSDIVIVNRANTYLGEGTPMPELLALVQQVLAARVGAPAAEPEVVPLEPRPADSRYTSLEDADLAPYAGEWEVPHPALGLDRGTTLTLAVSEGHLLSVSTRGETFRLYLQPDGSLFQEDGERVYIVLRDENNAPSGFVARRDLLVEMMRLLSTGEAEAFEALRGTVGATSSPFALTVRAVQHQLNDESDDAEASLFELVESVGPGAAESAINDVGYLFLEFERPHLALATLELNTRVFPEAFNVWDSLGDAHRSAGNRDLAIHSYKRALELNPTYGSSLRALRELNASNE